MFIDKTVRFRDDIWEVKPLMRKTIVGNIHRDIAALMREKLYQSAEAVAKAYHDRGLRGGSSTIRHGIRALIYDRHDFAILRGVGIVYIRPHLFRTHQYAYALAHAANANGIDSRISALARLGGIDRAALNKVIRSLVATGLLSIDPSGHVMAIPATPPFPCLALDVAALVERGVFLDDKDGFRVSPKWVRRKMPRQQLDEKIDSGEAERQPNPARLALARALVARFIADYPEHAQHKSRLVDMIEYSKKRTGGLLGRLLLPYTMFLIMRSCEPSWISDLISTHGLRRHQVDLKPGSQSQLSQAIRKRLAVHVPKDPRQFCVMREYGMVQPLREWLTATDVHSVLTAAAATDPVYAPFLTWIFSDLCTISHVFGVAPLAACT